MGLLCDLHALSCAPSRIHVFPGDSLIAADADIESGSPECVVMLLAFVNLYYLVLKLLALSIPIGILVVNQNFLHFAVFRMHPDDYV